METVGLTNLNGRHIVIVEDDFSLRSLITEFLEHRGAQIKAFGLPLEAVAYLGELSNPVDLVISDLRMEQMDGLAFLSKSRELRPDLRVIIMTGFSNIETALEAKKRGAVDYLEKPFRLIEMYERVRTVLGGDAIAYGAPASVNRPMGESVVAGGVTESTVTMIPELVGKSPSMRQVSELILRVAKVNTNVLIRGESGTGKELVAKAIHQYGQRSDKPFIAINCAAIPEALLESELFGYAKGAFTGAAIRKAGLIEEAEGGTLFLDEIGDMPMSLQAKLLRVVQERKIRAVGDNKMRSIDVRIISATHVDLHESIKKGTFREDLFYRLGVIPVVIPPLRDRVEDIPVLAQFFLRKYANSFGFHVTGFSRAAMAILMAQRWSGNVRELENVVERAVALCTASVIDQKDLLMPEMMAGPVQAPTMMQTVVQAPQSQVADMVLNPHPLGEDPLDSLLQEAPTIDELERRYISLVLKKTHGRRGEAARILGISRRTLFRKFGDKNIH